MRGGLDDALDKLARRDELRRRATSEATGTPAAVTELVEAIVAVVGRNPQLGVTVGVEGDGDPVVLRFYYEDGQVQVAADNTLTAQVADGGARHADFDVVVGEPVEEFAQPAYPPSAGPERVSHDDQDRYGPPGFGYEQTGYYGESDTAERRYGSFDEPARPFQTAETPHDLGARMRDLGLASSREPHPVEVPPHPLAATPPPPIPPQAIPPQAIPPQATRRIDPSQYRTPPGGPLHPEWADTTERLVPPPPVEPRPMPTPLPQPIPLRVERPEETEMAARRLAALLRDDPSLLNQRPE